MKKEFTFPATAGGELFGYQWIPEGTPKAVLQIIHGIAEYSGRYDAFAEFLNSMGILVVSEDHMGHGKSTRDFPLGTFRGGWFSAVDDCYQLMTITREAYPDIPYILFGHSMGSFLARSVLGRYPDALLAAAIICGTAWQPKPVLLAGLSMCKAICYKDGEAAVSKTLDQLTFGSYNKKIEHPRCRYDWLTRDASVVDAYAEDPLCGFIGSAGLLRDMMTGLLYIERSTTLHNMRTNLPILFIAGGDDPVGNYGKGVKQAYNAFCEAGIQDVSIRIFPLCRHEILNEINRLEIFQYIQNWLISKIETIR